MQGGVERVSTRKLADLLNVNPAVVKQDFLPLNVRGQTGVGYAVPELLTAIREVFLARSPFHFAIVGFGNIGQALANYISFERQGFKLRAIFDINPKLHNYSVRGVPVFDIDKIPIMCRECCVEIGVICTPASTAQEIANLLVAGDVRGIWNFAPTELIVPSEVILVHEHLTRGLLTLSYHIGQRHDMERTCQEYSSLSENK